MSASDAIGAITGIFIFIVCPIMIFRCIDKKLIRLIEQMQREKTARRITDERNKFLSKYAELINNGKSKCIALIGCLELFPEFSNMDFPNDCEINLVLNGKYVYVALPTFACDYTIQYLNDTYTKLCKEGKAPDSFYYEESKKFEPIVYGEDALEYEYVFVSLLGMINEETMENVKYAAYLIEEELLKSCGRIFD